MKKIHLVALGALSSSGVFAGCAVSGEESVRQTEQEAAAYAIYDPANYWTTGDTIEICFFGPESSATSRQTLADGVEEQDWGGLTADANHQCGSSPSSDTVTVYLTDPALSVGPYAGWARGTKGGRITSPNVVDDLAGGTIDIAPNYGNRSDVQIWMEWSPWSPESSVRILVHEVAHAIGIAHEHERNDAPDCPSDPEHKNMLLLTKLDPVSIMSYCATSNGRDPLDVDLSRLDQLGVEILYPTEGPLPLACGEGCVLSGTGVILREHGSTQDSWTARGAFPWWGSNFNRLFWEEGSSGPIAFGSSLSGTDLGPGIHFVGYSGRTKYSSVQVTGEGQVDVGDARWTSVVIAAL